jgi:multidrug efflux pump
LPVTLERLALLSRQVSGLQVYFQPLQDLSLEDRVTRNPFRFLLSGPDGEALGYWSKRLQERLRLDPALADVASDYQDQGLQAYVRIDREAAARLGVTVLAIDNALYNAFGQRLVV